MAKLAERFCLDLADTLTGDIELLTNLLKSALLAVCKTETQAKNARFTRSQGVENLVELLAEKLVGCCFCGRGRFLVLDEVTDMAIFFLTNRSFEGDRILRDDGSTMLRMWRICNPWCSRIWIPLSSNRGYLPE